MIQDSTTLQESHPMATTISRYTPPIDAWYILKMIHKERKDGTTMKRKKTRKVIETRNSKNKFSLWSVAHVYYWFHPHRGGFVISTTRQMMIPNPRGSWLLRFLTGDRPLWRMPSTITNNITTRGAPHILPHVHNQDKYYRVWRHLTANLILQVRDVNHSSRRRNGVLIIRNLHHSTILQLEWTDMTVAGGAWLGPVPSLWTEVKHGWADGRNTTLGHLLMERKYI